VPVLVDLSRSMRLADADGRPRLARAIALLKTDLMPALSSRFVTELYGVDLGEAVASAGSSPNGGASSRPTSKPTTASTSRARATARTRSGSAASTR